MAQSVDIKRADLIAVFGNKLTEANFKILSKQGIDTIDGFPISMFKGKRGLTALNSLIKTAQTDFAPSAADITPSSLDFNNAQNNTGVNPFTNGTPDSAPNLNFHNPRLPGDDPFNQYLAASVKNNTLSPEEFDNLLPADKNFVRQTRYNPVPISNRELPNIKQTATSIMPNNISDPAIVSTPTAPTVNTILNPKSNTNYSNNEISDPFSFSNQLAAESNPYSSFSGYGGGTNPFAPLPAATTVTEQPTLGLNQGADSGNWFNNLFSNSNNSVGGDQGDGGMNFGSLQGWGSVASGAGSIFNAFTAYQGLKDAREQQKISNAFANRNMQNQGRMLQAENQTRQAAGRNAGFGGRKAYNLDLSTIG